MYPGTRVPVMWCTYMWCKVPVQVCPDFLHNRVQVCTTQIVKTLLYL